ncbi:MAG: (d)CMP kinase [Elusimicrobia bacterium]|nr:(d)CMP kinase [Elusimicrobiota bacterium]
MKKKPIVTIDGPAGAGKSTIARIIAGELNFLYIDSGAMYRAVTWKVLNCKINLNDNEKIVQLAKKMNIKLIQSGEKLRVTVDDKDVTGKIRTTNVTKNVNTIAAIQGVREVLRRKQRELGKKGGVVMEGRDIGTDVFPEAEKKFYLDAKPGERALRRWRELRTSGKKVSLKSIYEAIKKRDYNDEHREINPLRKAKDAIVIDSSNMMAQQVAEKILNEIKLASKFS